MTISAIADQLKTTPQTVKSAIIKSGKFAPDEYKIIVQKRASDSLRKALSGRRKDVISNGRYNNVYSPKWMTKKSKKGEIGQHIAVVCKNLGLTELPDGYVVHHCNNISKDNKFENLVMMKRYEHAILHKQYLKGVETISKESTLKWVEARRRGADKSTLEDIVRTAQECAAASDVAGTD